MCVSGKVVHLKRAKTFKITVEYLPAVHLVLVQYPVKLYTPKNYWSIHERTYMNIVQYPYKCTVPVHLVLVQYLVKLYFSNKV